MPIVFMKNVSVSAALEKKFNRLGGVMVKALPGEQKIISSIPGQVIPNTLKMDF